MSASEVRELYLELARRLLARHEKIAGEAAISVNEAPEDIDRIAKDKELVVLYFTAAWCAPCVTFMESVKEVARRLKDKALFYKVDVDKALRLANLYNVEYLPAVVILKRGEVADKVYGVTTARSLEVRVSRFLK
ncbi:MAG: thioredoxin family protein [Acidilobaceae archaeon]|nr:thioredoxin family protein [Acidilobaceae archaeon]